MNDRGAEGTESGKESLECGCVVDLLHPKYCREPETVKRVAPAIDACNRAFKSLTEHPSKGNGR